MKQLAGVHVIKDERRQQIMDAAERVFLERGLGQATMEQIARAAGISKGGLYRFYETKDELFSNIATRALQHLTRRMEALPIDTSAYEWLRGSLRTYFEYAIERPDRFQVALSWVSAEYSLATDTHAFAEYRLALARAFELPHRALERGKVDGSVRPDLDSGATLLHMWGSTTGVLMLLLRREELQRRMPFVAQIDGMLEECARSLLMGIRNPAADLRTTHVRRRKGAKNG
jgi:AcrR family transcriptional regulator